MAVEGVAAAVLLAALVFEWVSAFEAVLLLLVLFTLTESAFNFEFVVSLLGVFNSALLALCTRVVLSLELLKL